MGSKQELGSYSEAYKRHEVIASVQLVTYMYCIQISMFKHPVSCLHVIGLLWPAVCKHANLLVTLVSTKINSHKAANKKNVHSSGSVSPLTLVLGTQSQPLEQLSANEEKTMCLQYNCYYS